MHWRRKWQPLQCSCLENPRDGGAYGLPSMGSHRVGHDWSDFAAAAAANFCLSYTVYGILLRWILLLVRPSWLLWGEWCETQVNCTTVLFLTNASFVFLLSSASLLSSTSLKLLFFPPHPTSVPQGYTEYTCNSKGITQGYTEYTYKQENGQRNQHLNEVSNVQK